MRKARRRGIGVAAAALCLGALYLGPASPARAAVYWGSGSTLGAATLEGAVFPGPFMKLNFTPAQGPACGVAVNGSDLYWAGGYGIGRTNLDGAAAPVAVVRQVWACGLALDQSHLFWTTPGLGAIGRAGLDGSEPNLALVHGINGLCAIAVGGGYVFWVDAVGIGRARVDGSEPKRILTLPSRTGCAVAADGQYLYWSGPGSIGRSNLDGSAPDFDFIAGIRGATGIAVDPTDIRWIEAPAAEGSPSSLGRATLAGAAPNPAWVSVGPATAGIAVDALSSISPRFLPSLGFSFGEVRRNLRKGTATLEVRVPASGTLELRWPQLGWRVRKPQTPIREGRNLVWRLRLWPGKGAFGKRIKGQLAATGRAPVNLKVAYAEDHSLPVTSTKLVVLRKSHPR
ncbi:MAG: virginiamycin lyase [Solirubrobacterales bacterium]|jgi:hypothetical protein|nr:virginiamycin lyase [Solirubrobacterales bacterium]